MNRSQSPLRVGVLASLLAISALSNAAWALANNLALTPPMGWNSWNRFGCGVSETLIMQTADSMVSSGMAAAGYQYVNIDDCWAASARDGSGNLVVDATKFPSGMKALADYVHQKGLKLGIYEDRGTSTCAGYPGSQGHEVQDAATFASWGIDYLKYDNCNASLDMQTQYTAMRDALASCGRPIVFSICAWQFNPWMPVTGNLWRTTNDISASFGSMTANLDINAALSASAKPGAWNDPDMLEVGNGGLTDAESRSHFSLWAIMASPLITGNDLRSMTANVIAIIENQEVIAVDQDSLGKQGTRIQTNGSSEVWAKPLRDGSAAVVLFNRGAAAAAISFNLSEIGITQSSTAQVRDLWAHADHGQMVDSLSVTVQSHDVAMFRVAPGADVTPPRLVSVLTMPDSATIVSIVFSEPIDRTSVEIASNYTLDHGIAVASATLLPDRQTVRLALSAALDTGIIYTVHVAAVKDLSNNTIASGASLTFSFASYPRITRIRFYPRTGWESRMVGGVFEGTSGNKDSATYTTLYVVSATPASNTWTDVTALTNNNTSYRYVRYRSPDNGFGNVSEVEFYSNTTKLTGTPFGTPGTWNNSGDDFTMVFDGNTATYFDCIQANGAYAGLDLTGSGTTVVRRTLQTPAQLVRQAQRSGRAFDVLGRSLGERSFVAGMRQTTARNGLVIVKPAVGPATRIITRD